MKISLNDVLDFVWTAKHSDLNAIADELVDAGYEFECSECESHECEVCDCKDAISEEMENFIRRLAMRLNQFGLDDMLSELEIEARSFGVQLNLRTTA
ncbi:hypothetical protein [Acinetobacter larvae]|uniref:Uncharacterized protein n=1 Tax=Acinetobacter larvae TaxID=1789224 RepID=A0A1B2LZ25_9GAMM|nr:hypothetical protein [Acinetobacter larvae]AOA58194.1 hypothetical protein BFG52_07405 [Acinetobacter larvae]